MFAFPSVYGICLGYFKVVAIEETISVLNKSAVGHGLYEELAISFSG